MADASMDTGQLLTLVFTGVTGLAAAVSAAYTARSVKIFTQQSGHAEKTEKGRMFLQISDKWTGIYDERNALLSAVPSTYDNIFAKYGQDARRYLREEEWHRIRKVCNFFETLGLLLERQYIDDESLFTLVTIDMYPPLQSGGIGAATDGVMYNTLKGPIKYVRTHYRPDLYMYYDDPKIGILPKYHRYIETKRNQALSAQRA